MLLRTCSLVNKSGGSVGLCNFGAAVTGIRVPDKNGRIDDVVLGYARLEDYIDDGACLGKTVGRYANRIAKAVFSLDGKVYHLACNNGPNHLHGGPKGLSEVFWEVEELTENHVVFSYISPEGEEGYPGRLALKTVYSWDDEYRLQIDFYGSTDRPTILNMTNHCYFNLNGEGSGSILGHLLQLHASRYLPVDQTLIPLGALAPVVDTPFDFMEAKPIGRDIAVADEQLRRGNGYDHCWAIDGEGFREAAVLMAPESGRRLTICTTQPGIQVYTGNFLSAAAPGKHGLRHTDRSGVALECQLFPDSPHHPEYPSALLMPDQLYHQKMIYRFSYDR